MLTRPSIIVASDFSEQSDCALRAAEKLRKKSGGRIHVIHVTSTSEPWYMASADFVSDFPSENFTEELMAGLRIKIASQIKKCGATADGEVLLGATAPSILDFVSRNRSDLLILGHREKGKILHLGGIAAKIMAKASVPVLIVNHELDLEKIAGLIDPHHPDTAIFKATEEFRTMDSGEAEFVSVWPDQSTYVEESFPDRYTVVEMTEEKKVEVKQRMESTIKHFAEPGARIHIEIAEEGKVEGLVKILEEDNVDLAIMNKHQKGKLEKFFIGSVTRGVLDHWQGNLLVLPS